MKDKKGILARLALLLTATIWGTSFVILKNVLSNVGVFWVMALRFTVAAVIFGIVAARSLRHLNRPTLICGILSGICLAVAYVVQTFGLKYTTPGKNAFLTAIYCVEVPFLIWIFFQRRPKKHNVVAALLSVAGIGFVSLGESFGNRNIGDILTLASSLFYALQIVVVDKYILEADSTAITAIEFVVAAVLCWIGAMVFEEPPVGLDISSWLSIIYMGAACTGLCFFLQAWGLRYTPAPTAAVIMTLESVIGAACSVIFYDDKLTAKLLVGFLLIFASVIISETGLSAFRRKRKA